MTPSARQSRSPRWDVIVVGAGPAGATAARVAAERGQRVLLLERASLPRYKTCGGGLVGAAVAALPPSFRVPSLDHIDQITVSNRFRNPRTVTHNEPTAHMVYRAAFDAALTEMAVEAGAVLRESTVVTALEPAAHSVTVTVDKGRRLNARCVVGADGSSSRVARHVAVRCEQVDLALEVEIPVTGPVARNWRGRTLLDWGALPGSYAWVFPKGDQLTIGVLAHRGHGDATRAYLREFLAENAPRGVEPVRRSGHLTRCRAQDSPLSRGRVLVAGDAAGLLDPMFREGISFALRSGSLAGAAAADVADAESAADVRDATIVYARRIHETLGGEMHAGRLLLAAFERHPGLFHTGLTRIPPISKKLFDYAAGRTTIPELVGGPPGRMALHLLSRM
ncbi:hypothetical protein A6A06_14655 [Streptomyces sp. CB02923]|uniref:geranylgeranyl reductase family protein n=1 Tax=Streptomyces sp. CB02923 TaxID=1718985 RepID=UPI00093D013E|nr:geranylgeranyl reductase family protein [Streptomyces sp. CB02923]OKI02292.1 hypothetical protein A6A06_14655 [Streptomyces sp. CB02923]